MRCASAAQASGSRGSALHVEAAVRVKARPRCLLARGCTGLQVNSPKQTTHGEHAGVGPGLAAPTLLPPLLVSAAAAPCATVVEETRFGCR